MKNKFFIILSLILIPNLSFAENNKVLEDKVKEAFSEYIQKFCANVVISRTDGREHSTEGATLEYNTVVSCNGKTLISITNTRTYDQHTTGQSTAYYTTANAVSQTKLINQEDLENIGAINFQSLAIQTLSALQYVEVRKINPRIDHRHEIVEEDGRYYMVEFERKKESRLPDDSI